MAARMAAIKTNSKRPKVPLGDQAYANSKNQDAVMLETCGGDEGQKRRRVSFSDLPWDTVNIVFDFTQSCNLKQFRLNKTFARLVNKRRIGLSFRDKQILPETFG